MVFWKLSKKHKKWFIINQVSIVLALIAAMAISWKVNDISMPAPSDRITAGFGFVVTAIFLLLAVMNRISTIFKIKSVGFVVMFAIFASLNSIADVLVWTTGLMAIPLLIDDIIFKPIWNNIWYNIYE